MTTLTINKELNGIEVIFDSKPAKATLDTLKANGFRWHNAKKLWYAKNTADRLAVAESIADGKKKIAAKAATDQKALKEKYMNVIKTEVWRDDAEMQEYARKKCEYVVELSNGNIVEIEKPKIQKNFCFGMGMYATYTQEQYEAAEGMANKARTDVNYFVEQNMAQVTDVINRLKECLNGNKECYTFTHYSGQPDDSILKAYKIVNICDNPEYKPGMWANLKDINRLGNEDIQAIIDGLEEVGKNFMKRLNTYLKKYGLEKLNVWTYCRD